MKEISCLVCKTKFKRKLSQVLSAEKHYCSLACCNFDKKKGRIISCYVCGKKVCKKNKDLQNSKSKKFFCSIHCSNMWIGSAKQGQNHPNWKQGRFSYKKMLERSTAKKTCVRCKETNELILVAHHIDQNRENNELSNLTWVCRNCHFLIHHYENELNMFNKNLAYAHSSM